ncbi:hypothetical protein OHS18_47230 [Amycolatopsis sp. NBC_00355]|uniref:hypothetical protein n=1 Tax=Amycolatopsis sp. NBC_00355 TaxID=2975957 RepID=UPI002E2702CC
MLIRATVLLACFSSLLLVLTGLASFPLYALVVWAVMSAMLGLIVWQQVDESPRTVRVRWGGRPPAQVAAASSLALFLAGVLAAETVSAFGFGGGAGILTALALAGYQARLRASRRRRAGEPPSAGVRSGDRQPAELTPAAVPGLDVAELCQAWQYSYAQLQCLGDSDTREQLVLVRRACLDELERRDPAGFRRWLASGARAGGDPGRFIGTGHGLVEPGADDAG